jgi:hypothetical protein
MATTPGANQMMGGLQMSGQASSGYGVTLSGFYCPNAEVAVRIQEMDSKEGPFQTIASVELNGHTLFVAGKSDPNSFPETAKIAIFRREPHKFFSDLPRFLYSLRAKSIDGISVSGSLGSVCLTILYRPMPEPATNG